jgi:outer membrane murein-binding lipoprotein Lpp
MKLVRLLIAFSILLSGCARKAELDRARVDLSEAQRKIEALETERVSRVQYENTRASLKLADEQIILLESELKLAQERLAAQEQAKLSADQTSEPGSTGPAAPVALGLVKGAYERSNETYVYSPDAQLNFGRHLQISSPSGLMVSDPEQKIVGGDLNIKAKDVMIESSDGLLSTAADGSVKFVGTTLTMKFENKKPAPNEPVQTPPPPNASTPEDRPGAPTSLPTSTSSP